jgi:hypothetical protein
MKKNKDGKYVVKTKRDHIYACYLLWDAISRKRKFASLDTVKRNLVDKLFAVLFYCSCPACEWASHRQYVWNRCEKCPLLHVWNSDDIWPCLSSDSPYAKCQDAVTNKDYKTAREMARVIAQGALEAYNE